MSTAPYTMNKVEPKPSLLKDLEDIAETLHWSPPTTEVDKALRDIEYIIQGIKEGRYERR